MDIFSSLLCVEISELFKFRLISYDSHFNAIIFFTNKVLVHKIFRRNIHFIALAVNV